MDLGSLQGTIDNFILIAQVVGGLLFVFFLILAGIYFMTSGGNPGSIEKSKSAAFNAVLGLIIVFSAGAIKSLIERAVIR